MLVTMPHRRCGGGWATDSEMTTWINLSLSLTCRALLQQYPTRWFALERARSFNRPFFTLCLLPGYQQHKDITLPYILYHQEDNGFISFGINALCVKHRARCASVLMTHPSLLRWQRIPQCGRHVRNKRQRGCDCNINQTRVVLHSQSDLLSPPVLQKIGSSTRGWVNYGLRAICGPFSF